MSYQPDISVIVPVYNADATLQECIESLLSLKYPEAKLKLIFVDNASTDKTHQILERYREKIRILYEAKHGPGAARNTGLQSVTSQIVAFTDSDCTVEPDWRDPGRGPADVGHYTWVQDPRLSDHAVSHQGLSHFR